MPSYHWLSPPSLSLSLSFSLSISLSLSLSPDRYSKVYHTWMVFEFGCRWLYSSYLEGCCFQGLFKTARSILLEFLSSFCSICFINIQAVHSYSGIDAAIIVQNTSALIYLHSRGNQCLLLLTLGYATMILLARSV